MVITMVKSGWGWEGRCLKRDGQKCIEPAAVADDVTHCEAQATSLITNPIDIDLGREKIRLPVAHDARD
jgi:hypothetical protein